MYGPMSKIYQPYIGTYEEVIKFKCDSSRLEVFKGCRVYLFRRMLYTDCDILNAY